MLNIFAEVMKRGDRAGKIRFIRFNPDTYELQGVKQKTSQCERQTALLRVLNTAPKKQFSVAYMFFDRAGLLPDVCLDPEYPSTLRAIASAPVELETKARLFFCLGGNDFGINPAIK